MKTPEQINNDVRGIISRLKGAILSAETHMRVGSRDPLTISFCLWSDLRKAEAVLKKHDPKDGRATAADGRQSHG